MAVFANLGIVQKIGLLCGAGVVVSVVTGATGVYNQLKLSDQAEVVRNLAAASGLMHHLDTREAELKVDAYRAVAEEDVPPARRRRPAGRWPRRPRPPTRCPAT